MNLKLKKTQEEWQKINSIANGKSVTTFITTQLRKQINHTIDCLPSDEIVQETKTLDYTLPPELEFKVGCLAKKLKTSKASIVCRLAVDPFLNIIDPEH